VRRLQRECVWRASGPRRDVHQLYGEPLAIAYIRSNFDLENVVIVSPDAGGAKRCVLGGGVHLAGANVRVGSATAMADRLGVDFALFHKERKKANEVSRMVLVGRVAGKTAVLVDDMADTCGTLCLAADRLREAGSGAVYAFVTHGILSGGALPALAASALEKLLVTNTLPQAENARVCSKIEVIDVAGVLGEVIRRSHYGESISKLFEEVPL
jgi:ribose-phosphate pyrophosphokinase